ncbi:MAG TPA: type IV secretion system protein [Steroidobacteraceae bacterium]|jgi:type IV secretion system protein VirB6|nr:type IV secretion system protein [Steroidobacteraceae bacterium]
MGFFAEFNAWLNGILATYIGNNTAIIASALQPAIVTLATVYVMIWGYLQLTGRIEEPVMTGVKRIVMLAVILGGSLELWLYNSVIVDTFFNAPGELAARVVGGYDSVNIVDQILFSGDDVANLLLQKGGIFHGNVSYDIAGFAVELIVGGTAVYTIFLLTLSRIALSVLLALGPLFIALLCFETTKRFFEAWIAQLANYAFITILTVLLAALMLTLISTAAQQAASAGGGIQIAQAVRVCLAAGLTVLVMRQVMPMAAGLASGLALSSFGVMSALAAWGFGKLARGGGQFSRGLLDRETTRYDTLSRKGGYYARRSIVAGARLAAGRRRENAVRAG